VTHGNELLAKSVCTVNRHAQVQHLSTHITAAAKRAGLTLKDIKLAITNR
jgi:isochorismate synthase EntC